MCVATGSAKRVVDDLLDKNFSGLFECYISGDDVKKGKPDPEAYLLALKKIGGSIKNTLVVENAPLGIESARKAGLKVYALETTLPKRYLLKSEKIFKNHKELFKEIEKSL
jgi:HAD superfamily hydrolase (TIGR01509 family)